MALISNKKAHLFYNIKRKISAGIELLGHEVKSLRSGKGSLEGGKVIVRGGEAFLVGAYIPAYQENNVPPNFDAFRNRKLLLNKKEIWEIATEESEGLTCVPLSLYLHSNLVKCELGLGKKRTKGDKREVLKKKASDREMRNAKYSSYDYE